MKRVPIATNFKPLVYQTFNETNLIRKQCKTLKIIKNTHIGRLVKALKCEILIIDT